MEIPSRDDSLFHFIYSNISCSYVYINLGKTDTLIEAIRRLKIIHPEKKLLVCAPSDAAADVLCDRLSKTKFTNKQMLRFNWWQRLRDSLQPSTLAIT